MLYSSRGWTSVKGLIRRKVSIAHKEFPLLLICDVLTSEMLLLLANDRSASIVSQLVDELIHPSDWDTEVFTIPLSNIMMSRHADMLKRDQKLQVLLVLWVYGVDFCFS